MGTRGKIPTYAYKQLAWLQEWLTYRMADQPDLPPSSSLLNRWPLLTSERQGGGARCLREIQLWSQTKPRVPKVPVISFRVLRIPACVLNRRMKGGVSCPNPGGSAEILSLLCPATCLCLQVALRATGRTGCGNGLSQQGWREELQVTPRNLQAFGQRPLGKRSSRLHSQAGRRKVSFGHNRGQDVLDFG